ncbi:hypothetical protein E1B28_006551 [Marasmius oreades]|uniref:Uncharacterized protein n=1 Tax=Marasmius oreades TaxID=181124 RepID=A0A9P7S677_9AGAR|nr:uncharacterized protein E1B28_006551 [Marasmius oreades]KAG7095858.1 hypothetical protein E1B28_006551 [Marasmius oreades]
MTLIHDHPRRFLKYIRTNTRVRSNKEVPCFPIQIHMQITGNPREKLHRSLKVPYINPNFFVPPLPTTRHNVTCSSSPLMYPGCSTPLRHDSTQQNPTKGQIPHRRTLGPSNRTICVLFPFCPRRFLCHRRDPSIPDFRIPHFFHPPLRPLLIDVRINNTSLPNRHSIPPSWYMDSPRLFRDVGKTLHLRFDAPGESQIGHNAVLRLRPPPCLYWFSSPRSGNHLLPSD